MDPTQDLSGPYCLRKQKGQKVEERKYYYLHLTKGERKCKGIQGGIHLTIKQTFAVLPANVQVWYVDSS